MARQPTQLFLIDGNSLAYRAFFALPEEISTSDGRPTNTIFGFASMLVKLLTDYGQQPTIVVWDKGMSGRKEISEGYKAHDVIAALAARARDKGIGVMVVSGDRDAYQLVADAENGHGPIRIMT